MDRSELEKEILNLPQSAFLYLDDLPAFSTIDDPAQTRRPGVPQGSIGCFGLPGDGVVGAPNDPHIQVKIFHPSFPHGYVIHIPSRVIHFYLYDCFSPPDFAVHQ